MRGKEFRELLTERLGVVRAKIDALDFGPALVPRTEEIEAAGALGGIKVAIKKEGRGGAQSTRSCRIKNLTSLAAERELAYRLDEAPHWLRRNWRSFLLLLGIAVPTLVSTLAISCVFTSVVFLDGPAKYLFTPLGLAVVSVCPLYGLPGSALACSTNWPPGARALVVTIEALTPNS